MKYLCEYVLLRFVDLLLQALPGTWAIALGEWLCLRLPTIIPKRQALILDNLTRVFPDKSAEEKAGIAQAVWRNLGRTAVEFVRIADFARRPIEDLVEVEGREHMERAIGEGKGVILLTAHFTNWELTGSFVQRLFGSMTAIARPVHNPYVNRWVQRKRLAGGMKIIPAQEAVKASLKCLKAKTIVGILIDQSLSSGLSVEFFGRTAATTTLPALLHVRTGAPVLITYTLREGDRFRQVFQPVAFPPVSDEADRIAIYTRAINVLFEDLIRRHPENWFWIHNRWKRA
ncbi:lysophospholipid acyltransferase family protein [Nitrospira sp. NS4]|uniref:lysophospholipid acyltransferase family protein n=1 Tax=Nitrospira sp. NS4 TaxID=3414498 RepID=UPI003C2F36E4